MSRIRASSRCFLFFILGALPVPLVASAQTASPPPQDGTAGAKAAPSAASPAPPPASSDADSAAPPPPDEAAEWVERDTELGEQSTLTGGAGLLRTEHAQTNAPGQFRLSFVGEWFSAGFLCTAKFPCPDPNGGPPITSDNLSHVGGTLSLGVSIAKLGPGTLDGSAGVVTYANSDTANRPALLQVLGDTVLGTRYVAPLGDIFHLGGAADLWLVNGSGSVGLDAKATSARFVALATADLRGMLAGSAAVQRQHRLLARQHRRCYPRHRGRAGPAHHAYRALWPWRQPRRPRRFPSRRGGSSGRRPGASICRVARRSSEQPPGLRVLAGQRGLRQLLEE